ncbi:CRISPR-associated DxTHG motif protein [Sulfolobus sp. E5-1-F]|uniref:TM1812 family CRISPR-associated protein n=1 Tax=Saccharolobus sp. E5-1-F TaxID=2663019 RepID=UPI001295A765|nr:TM1812 family CRISPR-associated protein [Sulfolobus sp. E5-1-F]QGA53939.1 CRISPR-associated DxTHG motif protein [Sulfolobus sp. E5-1-F]
MVVYVSTYGDPSGWSEVNYWTNYEETPKRSFTTVATYEKGSKIIIIVQDSVLTPTSNPVRNKVANSCFQKILGNNLSDNIKSYSDWIGAVENYIKCIVGEVVADNNQRLSVIVIPAIGKIGNYEYGKIRLKDKKKDNLPSYIYSSIVETLLVQRLYEELRDVNDDEVILDTTHGVNYLPALVLRVLYNLTSLLDLKFKVINYIPTVFQKEYTYIEISKYEGKRTFDLSQIREGKYKDNERKRLLIKSLRYNAPLLAIEICRKEERKDYYRELVGAVSIENNTITINEKFEPDPAWIDVIYDYACSNVKGNTKEDVEQFSEKVFTKFSPISYIIINRELNIIYTLSKKMNVGETKLYSELYARESKFEDEEKRDDKEGLKRNFIAHAGLLNEYVVVKKEENNKIRIDYAHDKIGELLKEVFDENPDIAKELKTFEERKKLE